MFATTTDNTVNDATFKLMKDIPQALVDKYGAKNIIISFITFGTPAKIVFDYNTTIPDKETLTKELNKVSKVGSAPDVVDALTKSREVFLSSPVDPESKKVVVFSTHRMFSNFDNQNIKNAVERLDKEGIRVIGLGYGNEPVQEQLKNLTKTERAIIRPPSNDQATQIADNILKIVLNGKDMFLCMSLGAVFDSLSVIFFLIPRWHSGDICYFYDQRHRIRRC